MIDHLEEKYYESLSDKKLIGLRDSIPSFSDRYNELENEVLDFCKNVDVDAIEEGIDQIHRYQRYKRSLKDLNGYKLELKYLNEKLSKTIFFKKKYQSAIIVITNFIEDLSKFIQECETDKSFTESFKINDKEDLYRQQKDEFLVNYTSSFEKSFKKLYNKEIKILNNNFKSIYYRIDEFQISEKNKPKNIFNTFENWDEDNKKYNRKYISVGDRFRFRFFVKTYPYLTRWDLKYFPYFLGEIFHKHPSHSIKIIDKVLLSRNNDVLIKHLREQNNT